MYKRSVLVDDSTRRGILMGLMLVIFAVPAFAGTGDALPAMGFGVGLGLVAFGLVVNEAVLAGMKKNFLTIFNQARSAYVPKWQSGAIEIPSNTSLNTYAWLEDFPKMREWLGDRYFKSLKSQAYSITNKKYETSVRVPRESIEDDQYGIFGIRFTAMGMAVEQLWDDLFFSILNSGFTGLSYDGKAFFATNHSSGSNKASGGGSVLSATSYAAAITAIKSQVDTNGDPLFNGGEPLTLWVPPALEATARTLLNNDFVSVAGGSTQNNIWKGSANLIVSPKITTATNWFLTIEFMGLKPFIVQKRTAPEFISIEDPNDHQVFNRDEFSYGARARGNSGYGLHQLAYGSVGA